VSCEFYRYRLAIRHDRRQMAREVTYVGSQCDLAVQIDPVGDL
jgi:hypothetical protein